MTENNSKLKNEKIKLFEGDIFLTAAEMEQALSEAREIVQNVGTIDRPYELAAKWMEKYFCRRH